MARDIGPFSFTEDALSLDSLVTPQVLSRATSTAPASLKAAFLERTTTAAQEVELQKLWNKVTSELANLQMWQTSISFVASVGARFCFGSPMICPLFIHHSQVYMRYILLGFQLGTVLQSCCRVRLTKQTRTQIVDSVKMCASRGFPD